MFGDEAWETGVCGFEFRTAPKRFYACSNKGETMRSAFNFQQKKRFATFCHYRRPCVA